ncbi:MAG: AI-2E family transporter [Chloroflexi bacterium]|nr:AI-2E family transporter [Chloroflexota bacterium]MYE39277.1 AI-2E family transporter [Chloroflexota bacterium]
MLKQLDELPPSTQRRIRLVAALLVAVALLVVAWQLLLVLVPLAVSAVIASLLIPLMRLGERTPLARRWPRFNRVMVAGIATLLGVVIALTVIGIGAYALVGGATTIAEVAPAIIEEADSAFAQIAEAYRERVPETIQEQVDPRLESLRDSIYDSGVSAVENVANLIQSNIGQFVTLLATPIAVFQFLYQPSAVPQAARRLIPAPIRDDLSEMGRLAGTTVIAYIRVQLVGAIMVGVTLWLLYWAVGIKLALPLGMLAAVTELVPVIGTTLFLLLMVIAVALTDLRLLPLALVFYFLVQVIQNSLVTPRLHGMALGVHPMALVLSLAIFGMFFGILGALVAAPVTGAAYRVLQYVGREWESAGVEEAGEL